MAAVSISTYAPRWHATCIERRAAGKSAYWERGEWWLAGDAKPWQPEAMPVFSDRLTRPRRV